MYYFDWTGQLLNSEPRASEQVPLLIKMRRDQLALTKALESGDTDLGKLFLIMHMYKFSDS